MPFRFRVFLCHLGISGIIALLMICLVFGVWYPKPFYEAVGVTKIFLLVLLVDVVVGPLLTLIIAKQGKKSLRFDLAIIGVCQIAALSYGLWVVAEGRPVWLVFNVDRVDLVQAFELNNPYASAAKGKYRKPPLNGPQWVAARIPEDVDARNTLTFDAVFAGVDLPQRPDLYIPYHDEKERIQLKAQPLAKLNQFNDEDLVNSILVNWPQADAFLPMMAPTRSLTVLIEKESGNVVAVVALEPW